MTKIFFYYKEESCFRQYLSCSKERLFKLYRLCLTALFSIICIACAFEDNSCFLASDCKNGEMCLAGVCSDDKESCKSIGVFETVAETVPKNATKLQELHVTFDTEGAAHYCYFGFENDKAVSYYGKQVSIDSFREEPLQMDNSPIMCASIEIARDGTPYVLSKYPVAILRKAEGKWKGSALPKFDTQEAKSAFRSSETVFSLTRAGQSDVYLAVSMGFQTANQPILAAHVSKDAVDILFNGQQESGDLTIVGYGPHIVEIGNDKRLISGRIFQNSVVLAELDLNILFQIQGLYPKAASNDNGFARVAYINHNDELLIGEIGETEISPLTNLGNVYPSSVGKGHIPWTVFVDDINNTHLLFEDSAQGQNAVLYQKVFKTGEYSRSRILTEELSRKMSGTGLYALYADQCGNVTAAIVEEYEESEEIPKLRIIAER